MALICPDGARAEFPPRPPVPPPRERGAPWRPPDTSADVCTKCGRVAWQHPAVADPIGRAV